MNSRTLQDLSPQELQQLGTSYQSGNFTDKDQAIIKTLDSNTLNQLAQQHQNVQSPQNNVQSPQNNVQSPQNNVQSPQNNVQSPGLLSNIYNGTVNTVLASRTAFIQGSEDAIQGAGELAKNALKAGATALYGANSPVNQGLDMVTQPIGNLWDKTLQTIKPSNAEVQNAVDHPITYGISAGIGNTVTSLLALGKPLQVAGDAVDAVGSKVAPMLFNNPIAKNVISQGLLGGTMNSLQNPNTPVSSFATGAALGGSLGAVTGAIGYKLQRQGDIMNYQMGNLVKNGTDPSSIEGVNSIQKALKDNGVEMSKEDIRSNADIRIQRLIKEINPVNMAEEVPSKVIANIANTNFQDVSTRLDLAKNTLSQDMTPFNPINYNAAKTMLSTKTQGFLPDDPLPQNPTIGQMWQHRQELDDTLSTLRRQSKTDASIRAPFLQMQNLRGELTNDIAQSAEKAGISTEWNAANNIYKNEYLPFKSLIGSGKMNTPDDVTDAMSSLNRIFNAKLSVPLTRINKISGILGSDGNELIGKAMLQNAYEKALDPAMNGNVNPNTMYTQIKKFNAMGVSSEIWGPNTRNAANAIQQIAEGTVKAVKLSTIMDPAQMSFLQKNIPNLLATRPGMQLLKVLGSSNTTPETARGILQNLSTGIAVKFHSLYNSNNQSTSNLQNPLQNQNPQQNQPTQ